LVPRFPPLQGPQLPCPPIGRPSSALSKKILFYIHEKLLRPLSVYYCRLRGLSTTDPATGNILPFGLILKCSHRATEQEGLAMNLARAMGVPAPRFISFGQPPPGSLAPPSILMTHLRGTELDQLDDDKVDLDVIRGDLINILATMRRFTSPHGDAVCGVNGGGGHSFQCRHVRLARTKPPSTTLCAISGISPPLAMTSEGSMMLQSPKSFSHSHLTRSHSPMGTFTSITSRSVLTGTCLVSSTENLWLGSLNIGSSAWLPSLRKTPGDSVWQTRSLPELILAK
ncbi:hypothetical protein C8Q78DRAFT_1127504, partial [Trametes maxima]